ncbi:MAG: glycosyltransferase family 2 protein [Sulfurospirillum sp.]
MNIVSIAMTTYNGEKFLKEQLNSIINQSYKNLEIIICDDGSFDNTIRMIKEYQKRDNRIKLFENKKSLGVLKNFEKAISLCNGDYIAISDQDDIWMFNKIEVMINEIKDCVLVYHDDSLINRSGKLIYSSFFQSNNILINKEHSIKALMLDNWISGHACMFSSVLKNHILPISEDIEHYDMWIAIVASIYGNIRFIDKQLVLWRQHGTNTSGSKIDKRSLLDKIFNPIDSVTMLDWNKNRIRRLKFLKKQTTSNNLRSFIDDAINYYTLSNRFKAFIFALLNIKFIIQKKGLLRKIKYILLPIYAPKVKID